MTKESDEADVAAGQATTVDAKKKESVSRRQRRKTVNDKHKWPQMPKIQSEQARANAYIRVAGLKEPKQVDFDLNDPSVRFGRLLGSADQRLRHQAVLRLESFLRQKCEIRDDEDEEDVSTLMGISELDLLKLWKALWHTLYMADKVPVQQELSRKLAKLIWCVAGTEEEDEYAAQVYLDMYGDADVGFDDDEEQEEGEEGGKHGDDDLDNEMEDEGGDEESYTIEEIENTLREEIGEEDSAEVEEEEEEEEEEGLDDSEIPHCRGAHLASLFVRTFFRTVRREWGHVDKYRVDKFYSLMRMVMHEVFKYMSRRHWGRGIVRIFNDVLHEEILSQTPNGLRYHLIDLTLEELAIVNTKAPMPLTEATLLDCLEPYFAMVSVDVGDDSVKSRVMENVLLKFLEDYSVVSPKSAKDKTGKPLTMDQVHVGTIAEQIFSLASDTDTPDQDRAALYEMHKRYLRAIKKAGRDVDIEGNLEESDEDDVAMYMECDDQNQNTKDDALSDQDDEASEEEKPKLKDKNKKKARNKEDGKMDYESVDTDDIYDGDVDTPERQRKRKLTSNKEEEEPSDGADGKNDKKKKKKKRKKKKESRIVEDNFEVEAVDPGPFAKRKESEIGPDKDETARDEANGTKKKKKTKAKSSTSERFSSDDAVERKDEIKVTLAEQKRALKAMKSSRETPKAKTSKSSKTSDGESSLDRKRVKFGDTNMARSWRTSMKGLRTMSPVSPLPKPEKGILYNKKGGDAKTKTKKIRARTKATDYF